jgi:hypothetical protein
MEYIVDGREYVHAFRSQLLTDEEIESNLKAVGLRERERLDDQGSWIDAVPVESRPS